MKNNTKVRLHLSKQLFESLTKEIIKEAKANDGYTVAVKQPKQPKQSKSQAASPEVQKTDAEAMMGEAGAPPMPPVPGKSATDKLNLAGANMEIKDAKTFAKVILDIAKKLESKEGFKPESNPSIKRAMDALRTVSSGIPAMPSVPAKKSDSSAPKAPAMPPVPGKVNEMEFNVAEEGQLDEFTGTETESSGAIAMLAAALGMGVPLAAALIKDLMKKKTPEEKKQAVDAALTKKTGADTTNLKEYEHHYEVRNGECRRYNDEGEYEVVSMHHCR